MGKCFCDECGVQLTNDCPDALDAGDFRVGDWVFNITASYCGTWGALCSHCLRDKIDQAILNWFAEVTTYAPDPCPADAKNGRKVGD